MRGDEPRLHVAKVREMLRGKREGLTLHSRKPPGGGLGCGTEIATALRHF